MVFSKNLINNEQPLAARMRPQTLDEFVGQEHIVAPGRLLRRAIQADQLSSLLFYGPPGTGKTTLARVIANTTKSHFETLNAVLSGVKDIRRVTEEAQNRQGELWGRTILFVDEVHRWNKAQQDALLPWVENGTIVLVGATTENPYFTVNRALVSRSRIFQLKPLSKENLGKALTNVLSNSERGYGKLDIRMDAKARDHLINVANGDCRALLNALELAIETTAPTEEGTIVVDLAVAEESIQRRAVLYDKEGDYHFDTISAFIKSLRGSDPDAALYWLAKMVYAGEDLRYLFRRMLIFAGEDIGLADPNALVVTEAAASAFDRIGMPEGCYPLGMAALYLSTAPKSNSVMAFFDAINSVENEHDGKVPNHLKDASRDKEGFGHGLGYLYPHAYKDHWVNQQYLPVNLQGKVFYQPGQIGYEKGIAETVHRNRELQLAASLEFPSIAEAPPEILTFSPKDRNVDKWLDRTMNGVTKKLEDQRQRIFSFVQCQRHSIILDVRADNGLLTWEALRQAPEGGVFSLVNTLNSGAALSEQVSNLPQARKPIILTGNVMDLKNVLSEQNYGDVCFDVIVGRNFLGNMIHGENVFAVLRAFFSKAGTMSLAQIIPKHTQRLYRLVNTESMHQNLIEKWRIAEEAIYSNPKDEMVNWDENHIESLVIEAGFEEVKVECTIHSGKYLIREENLRNWFSMKPKGTRPSYAQHLLKVLNSEEMNDCEKLLRKQILGKTISWNSTVAFIFGRS